MNQKKTSVNKKIALVWHLDYPGGVQYCVLTLVKALNQRGIKPILLWDHAPNAEFIQKEGVEIDFQKITLSFPTSRIRKLPVSFQYLLNIFNCKDISEILSAFDFTYLFQNNLLVSGSIPHIRYLSGPPLLPQLENPRKGIAGVPYRFFRWMYKRWLKNRRPAFEFHRDNHYVINSAYTAALFEEAHGTRLEVVHPPISLTQHGFDPEDITQRDTISFFSRITPAKRPDKLFPLANQYPERFIIMGGVNPQMQSFLDTLKQSAPNHNKIEFIINPDSATIFKELSRTRFYVFPAINEHFGMTTVEAIASGAIPFVHDSGGQKEIVPLEALRFNDENFLEKFALLKNRSDEDLNQIRRQLKDHVRQFSTDVYLQKMLGFAKL